MKTIQSRFKISGSVLKLLAVVSMLVDHVGMFVFRNNEAFQQVLFTIGSRDITPYFLMRAFGRLAFPIFAFLIVEGFVHTRNRFSYGRNLLFFALLSEIPWNLIHGGTWLYSRQNVFFTLFLGYMGLCCYNCFKENIVKRGMGLMVLLGITFFFRADYGFRGFAFILMLYALRNQLLLKSVIGCCMLPGAWIPGISFIPISLYDGRRGFIRGAVWKFCFYAFYPLHLMLLYLFCR
ncbi:MAG: hypothetical protein IJ417_00135 [Bacteroidaceae bacterium]|nr:hypothetical protein [Bacteroidaceae bacterium]